jgi:hypothetical protein
MLCSPTPMWLYSSAFVLHCTALHCRCAPSVCYAAKSLHIQTHTLQPTLVTLTPLPVPLCACVRRNNTLGVRVLRSAAQCSAAFVYRVDP